MHLEQIVINPIIAVGMIMAIMVLMVVVSIIYRFVRNMLNKDNSPLVIRYPGSMGYYMLNSDEGKMLLDPEFTDKLGELMTEKMAKKDGLIKFTKRYRQ